jgi:hypothetical protein
MVTYMVFWMSRHAKDMKGDLVGAATAALAKGVDPGTGHDGVPGRAA